MKRFHGDLWNAEAKTIDLAARGIMWERGFDVVRVQRILTGQYVEVELSNGSTVILGYDVIQRYVWENAS